METFVQDLRYAARILLRAKGFTLIAVLAVALGIGANAAIFSLVNAVILKPLPYPQAEQLVQVWMRFTGIGIPNDQNWVSAPEFRDLQKNDAFTQLAAISGASYNIRTGGAPERIEAAMVSPAFFPLLGVQAQMGRVFLEEEGQTGKDKAVLLSDGLWRRRFGADPGIVGRKLAMNGQDYLVVGVLPPGFQRPADAEVWTPLAFTPDDFTPQRRGGHGLEVIARIPPGLSMEQARSRMAAVSQRIIEENPSYPYRQFHFAVLLVPLLEQEVGDIRTALWVLMGAVGLVLLIACGNVANLLLARASARQREIAVRQALGVGRWRLARQLLTESVLLALAGGVTGLALAYGALRVLIAASATSFPRVAETKMDIGVLVFTLFLSLLTGILFGLVPALRQVRHSAWETLKEGSRGTTGGDHRLRSVLVVGELALSLVLLAGSGLLIRSFLRLQEVDSGFRSQGVLTVQISLPQEKYGKREQSLAFYRGLLERVRQLPGVDLAGAVQGLPLSGTGFSGTATIDTTAVPPDRTTPEVDQRPITPGYFETLGIALVRGRYFDERDNETAAPVAIIDETLAQTYWPGQNPLGNRIRRGGNRSSSPWCTIVGVVRHVRYRTLESPSRTEFYWPVAQSSNSQRDMSLAIHTMGDPRVLVNAVERQVQALDADQPVFHVRTMEELVRESMARRRLSMFLLAIFAGAALLLAALGIYGLMSYAVAQRTHELGIRMALGARSEDVVWLVLGRTLWLSLAGVGLGMAASLALTRLLSQLLFNVEATDPFTYGLVALFLAVVAQIATFVPAYRAATIDPVDALRQE